MKDLNITMLEKLDPQVAQALIDAQSRSDLASDIGLVLSIIAMASIWIAALKYMD